MTKAIDRLYLYLENQGIPPTRFEKEAGLSNGYLGLQKKRKADLGEGIIKKILDNSLHLNINWLITGQGEMLKSSKPYGFTPIPSGHLSDTNVEYMATTPVAKPPAEDKNLKKSVHPTVHPTAENSKKSVSPTVSPTTILAPQIITFDSKDRENIIYVGAKAAAGYLNGYADREYMETLPAFTLPGLTGGTFRAFEVQGSSMVPTLENGEMVIGKWVEKLEYIREDRVHIIVTKYDGIVVKRVLNRINQYGYLVAKSDAVNNRNEYPNLHVHPADILEVWYAVWHGGFNFKAPAEMYQRINNLEADVTELMRLLRAKDQNR